MERRHAALMAARACRRSSSCHWITPLPRNVTRRSSFRPSLTSSASLRLACPARLCISLDCFHVSCLCLTSFFASCANAAYPMQMAGRGPLTMRVVCVCNTSNGQRQSPATCSASQGLPRTRQCPSFRTVLSSPVTDTHMHMHVHGPPATVVQSLPHCIHALYEAPASIREADVAHNGRMSVRPGPLACVHQTCTDLRREPTLLSHLLCVASFAVKSISRPQGSVAENSAFRLLPLSCGGRTVGYVSLPRERV
jgi:hypothetical protein